MYPFHILLTHGTMRIFLTVGIDLCIFYFNTRGQHSPFWGPHLALEWFLSGPSYTGLTLHYITIQCDESLKWNFQFKSTADFYKKYILPRGKSKNILTNAKLMISLFGSTYACEQLFSKMKYTKSHLRTRLCDNYLDDVLLLSLTNISPDVEKLLHN